MNIDDNYIYENLKIIKRGHVGKPDLMFIEINGQTFRVEEKNQHESFKKIKSDIESYRNFNSGE